MIVGGRGTGDKNKFSAPGCVNLNTNSGKPRIDDDARQEYAADRIGKRQGQQNSLVSHRESDVVQRRPRCGTQTTQ